MAANTSLNLVSLDFDTIKANLKTYMKSQTQFTDYDFEGSNMSVLIDLLAYNAFHHHFFLNMAFTESFLDSAQLRNSVVSHAKELNYLPRSSRSAKATLNLNFNANTNVVTLPKGTSFTTTVGYKLYTFITDHEYVFFSSNNSFAITGLDVYEGQLQSDTFIVNYDDNTQRFLLTDPKVDTRSIDVTVTEDNEGNVLTYSPASSTLGLDADSQVYFLQAVEDGKYEVVFGDGILGRRPKDNSVVEISYRTCNEDEANGASKFQLDTGFADFTSTPTINAQDVARGGAKPESIASIKFYAPRHFQTQERAVNTNDYEIILQQRFPEINALSAYGGENLDPPQYGKVFISVDISDVDGLPSSKITEYSNFIKPRSPLSIDTVFVEPDYLYYSVKTDVKYSVNDTAYTSEQIKSLVANKIITYNDTYLDDFKASFKYSKFVRQIDDIENAGILSNDTDISVYKKITPTFGVATNYSLDFDIPLTNGGAVLSDTYDVSDITAVYSDIFTSNGVKVQIQDDGDGKLRLVKSSGTQNVVVNRDIGTVDYTTGDMKINSLTIDSLEVGQNSLRVYARPDKRDFETRANVILTLETSKIEITVTPVREGTSSAQTRQRI